MRKKISRPSHWWQQARPEATKIIRAILINVMKNENLSLRDRNRLYQNQSIYFLKLTVDIDKLMRKYERVNDRDRREILREVNVKFTAFSEILIMECLNG